MEGCVKWFDDRKGYGFIIGADGNEYFVHWRTIQNTGKRRTLKAKMKVKFVPSFNKEGGRVATDVEVNNEG